MKKMLIRNKFETGQVMPLIVLMMFAIIGMVALLLDGGAIMSNKRTAQAAADAGALAGAKRLCLGKSDAKLVAENYATKNKATTAVAVVYNSNDVKTVTVNTEVTNPSFFARIFGQDTLPAKAVAEAGCLPPSGLKVLPIAWACLFNETEAESASPDCLMNALDWETEMKPLIGHVSTTDIDYPGELYVVMDSMKTNVDSFYFCADPLDPTVRPPGVPLDIPLDALMDCDLNNDGVNDVLAQGDRSWLDLDGGLENASDDANTSNGANALKQWIIGNGVPKLAIHTWLGGQTGVATTIYKTVDTEVVKKNRVSLIPVFDGWCPVNPDLDTSSPSCIKRVHDAELAKNPELVPGYPDVVDIDHEPIKVSPGAGEYFHIIGFSAFFVTCVDDGGGPNKCPGAKEVIAVNTDIGGAWESMKGNIKIKSLEGYFIDNFPLDQGVPGTGGVDMGLYTVSLLPTE